MNELQHMTIQRSSASLYVTNDRGRRTANRWHAQVQPGQDDDGARVSDAECEAVAALLAAAPKLRDACAKAQAALAMMTSPDAIQSSSVLNAYAAALAAEDECRAALAAATPGEVERG